MRLVSGKLYDNVYAQVLALYTSMLWGTDGQTAQASKPFSCDVNFCIVYEAMKNRLRKACLQKLVPGQLSSNIAAPLLVLQCQVGDGGKCAGMPWSCNSVTRPVTECLFVLFPAAHVDNYLACGTLG
jgi:hypothetical protein